MLVQPYLFFEGRCEEALEFYTKVLGAKVEMKMRYSESPEAPQGMPAGYEKKIMHSAFKVGDTTLMGSDGMCSGQSSFKGFSLSVSAKDEAEAKRLYAALSEGGQQTMPLTKTFFSPAFGMLTDKFGVGWMVLVATM
jgi:PhnB protein